MTKKKLSGQTVAIVVLSILLLASITFGGVFAFYSTATNRVAGTISLATLNIDFDSSGEDGESGTSAIVLSNYNNVVPSELLGNTPLEIINTSNAAVYIAVVYQIKAIKTKDADEDAGQIVEDDFSNPIFDIGVQYGLENMSSDLTYFLFTSSVNGKKYHCWITKEATLADKITIIKENSMRLHRNVTSRYMSCNITFKFQGFAIGEGKNNENYASITNLDDRCQKIMDNIYQSYENTFTFFDNAVI